MAPEDDLEDDLDNEAVEEFAEKIQRARDKEDIYAQQKSQREDAPVTDEDLAAMEKRAGDATRGPWYAEILDGYITGRIMSDHHTYEGKSVTDPLSMTNFDSEFIAYARTDIPRLIREVRRLRTLTGESK